MDDYLVEGLLSDRDPPELLIADEPLACPYLPNEIAKLPFRIPIRTLLPRELDVRLDAGDRRNGMCLYTPQCPSCTECKPIRVVLAEFSPSRSQRRTFSRCQREVTVQVGPLLADPARVALYNAHLSGRGLSDPDAVPIDLDGYRSFLVDRCCSSLELRLLRGGQLVGVAITDVGEKSLSAHYTFFDPTLRGLGLGTFAILMQIELARSRAMTHLYLGLWVRNNEHMQYKARFRAHQLRGPDGWKTT